MGGTPRFALLSLMLPAADHRRPKSTRCSDGLLDWLREAACASLAGGNITRSPGPLIVDVTVIGSVRPRKILTRGGGRPGDDLYVTGHIGAAAAGPRLAARASRAAQAADAAAARIRRCAGDCVARYRRPDRAPGSGRCSDAPAPPAPAWT